MKAGSLLALSILCAADDGMAQNEDPAEDGLGNNVQAGIGSHLHNTSRILAPNTGSGQAWRQAVGQRQLIMRNLHCVIRITQCKSAFYVPEWSCSATQIKLIT